MPNDKVPNTGEAQVDALRKQITFYRGELARLHNEYYAAIRQAKAQTPSSLPRNRGAFIAHPLQ
jgi:hypothetical protein